MLKKIILSFLVIMFSLFSINTTFAISIPVENVFSDINSDYEYKKELQSLYDKGMITPDNDGNFNPKELLNRDEFVGILTEITCKKCIQPYTIQDLLTKYENKNTFFDIGNENKYFYCIESASSDGFVSGYHEGTNCENGSYKSGEKPFCPNNTIILEEAIAIILRSSGILTNEEANIIRQEIYDGKITESISDDVNPRNIDGSVYTFYPDLRKALEYEVVDVDVNGNIGTSTLIELVNGKLRPKQAISKEDFLKIAYIVSKANSCKNESIEESNLALNLIIYDKSCDINNESCNLSDLNDESNTYDFSQDVVTTCESGISNPEGYIWRFYNTNTLESITIYGKYIDNYSFLSGGEWKIFLRVTDNCGKTSVSYRILNILIDGESIEGLGLKVDADKIYLEKGLDVTFSPTVEGGEGPYTCIYDYGDGKNGISNKHIFEEKGIYEVKTTCSDANGLESEVLTIISVVDGGSIEDAIGLKVEASVLYGEGPLEVEFTPTIEGGEGPYTCEYEYGDGNNGIDTLHIFEEKGIYEVKVTCSDINGLEADVLLKISVIDKINDDGNITIETGLGLKVDADKVYGVGPLDVEFTPTIEGGEGPYTCSYQYGDGENGISNIHIFKEKGVYEVKTLCSDINGLEGEALTVISVIELGVEEGLGLKLDADKIYGEGPLEVEFTPTIEGGRNPYSCSYDYGDGESGTSREHIFKEKGIYTVVSTCNDINGLESQATIVISVIDKPLDDFLNISTSADPIFGKGPLLVDFKGIVFGNNGPFSYSWDFGDGNKGNTKNIQNIFIDEGYYEVVLYVTDSIGKIVSANIIIIVNGESNIDTDTDGDNIIDNIDLCPLILGSELNQGCPILEEKCDSNGLCGDGLECSEKGICLPKVLSNSCEYKGGDIIFGNVVCNTCPCSYSLDFISNLRKCDIIFPAITSKDGSTIYGKGEKYQIK